MNMRESEVIKITGQLSISPKLYLKREPSLTHILMSEVSRNVRMHS